MKKIVLTRKNEYVSRFQTFSIYLNGMKYLIDTNSSLTINTDDKEVKIYAKLLWMKTRIIDLNPDEKEFNIRIKPFMDNNSMIVSIFLFLITVLCWVQPIYPC